MDVTFYKTKLTRQNRCYGVAEYDNYLNGCTKKVITLSHDIVPNNPFYLETDEGMWGYNYITYTYKGYLFGAFIDGIRIQALSGSTQIIHATDSWYFALKNVGIDNMDFHGQCIRAHVNDVVQKGSNHYATLQNTTSTPEETFNEANCVWFLKEPPYSWTYDNDIYWLYIYISNIDSIGATGIVSYGQEIKYPFGDRKRVSNIGVTLCYPVSYYSIPPADHSYLVGYYRDLNGEIGQFRLEDLTYSLITAMIITKIPPRGDLTGFNNSGEKGLFPQSYLDNLRVYKATESFPIPLNLVGTWTPCEFKFSDDTNYALTLFADDNLTHLTSAEDFRIWGCYKLHTSVYNPLRYGDNFINTLSCNKNDSFYFSLTFDLSQTIVFNPSANYSGLQGITLRNNSLVFAPNSINDYWTRLNALQTSIAGQVVENQGIIQGVKVATGAVSNAVRSLASVGAIFNDEGGIGGMISSAGNAVGNIVDTAGNLATIEQQGENAELTQQSGQITQEIAAHQYRAGTTTNRAISYFGLPSCDESALISGVWNLLNFDAISKNLHRYGYNTFLQLDDIYFNHKRENFNYIKAADCEVVGVPTDIATDLENMFLNGVHLWSGEVENFEVVNYQEGLTW